MGLINGTVSLENNYELWKSMFDNEKEILKDIFKDVALSIEHVGSTAVLGLSAKPIVDIAIGVKNLDDVLKINSIEPTYNIKDNSNKGEILLIKESDTETFFLIHVLNIDNPLIPKRNASAFFLFIFKDLDLTKIFILINPSFRN